MPRFIRTSPAPQVKGPYGAFRPYVRNDFQCCCAYCLLHEDWAGGADNFELDHFRPVHLFPKLQCDFYNLYYSCHVCNSVHGKGMHWPSEEEIAHGIGFVDLCQDDWEEHYELLGDGRLNPLTASAEYTLEKIRLNNEHLIRLRAWAIRENRRLDQARA